MLHSENNQFVKIFYKIFFIKRRNSHNNSKIESYEKLALD